MNNVDYMQNNDGKIVIFCEQIPDRGFIDAIKVRNICTARIRSVQEKKANKLSPGPDVELIAASGEKNLITRKELQNNFVHCNGKRIKVMTLRSNCKYCVYNVANQGETYKVLKIPDNCTGSLGTKEVRPGYYLIAKASPDGTIDKSTLTVISPKLFRKSFKIPVQAVIKRHMYKTPNKQFGLFNPARLAEVRGYSKQNSVKNIERAYPQEKQPHQINMGTGLADLLGNRVDRSTPVRRVDTQSTTGPVSMPPQQSIKIPNRSTAQTPTQTAKPRTNYKYTVTHRVVGATNTALLGYAVKELSTGKTKQLSVQQVMKLCELKLVDNIMLVQRESGIKFLKGNNISIESLPKIIG